VRPAFIRDVVVSTEKLPDFKRAPNQGDHADLYELENQALDPGGYVLTAMRARAPWARRSLLDLGCGSGYWLAGYADEAAAVIGVEPDPRLLSLAAGRDTRVRVRHGSAEHIPLPDQSVDVVHARFAYFFPPAGDAGLAEVMRVLRPGGTLVFVGNDLRAGDFAGLVRAAAGALEPTGREAADAWQAARGADRTTVRSAWQFTTGLTSRPCSAWSSRSRWPGPGWPPVPPRLASATATRWPAGLLRAR
jgi:SAM-dependent methyltransferase